jgi:glycine betaine catabolism A
MLTSSTLNDTGYNGLTELTDGLPAESYFDPRNYERELQRIWYRNWVYVGRSSEVGRKRSFATFELGDQRILLVRDDAGQLQAFHNTCRHRGAELCKEPFGQLKSGQIVCPYHAWAYTMQGDLLRTTSKRHAQGFEVGNFPLYKVRAREWNGFIFVALTDDPPPFEKLFDLPIDRLKTWPLEDLVVGHVLLKTIQCNWKIYWENYNECLHCPGVHPKLSQLVPIYGRGLLEERDDPYWTVHATEEDPKFKGGLRSGAETWSLDGRAQGRAYLHDGATLDVHRRPRRLRARRALAAARTRASRIAGRVPVPAGNPGGPKLRSGQRGGFHQSRHDRRCRYLRSQPARPARRAARSRSRDAGGVCPAAISRLGQG